MLFQQVLEITVAQTPFEVALLGGWWGSNKGLRRADLCSRRRELSQEFTLTG